MLVMALMNLCVLSCSVMSDSLQKSSVSVSKHRGQKECGRQISFISKIPAPPDYMFPI